MKLNNKGFAIASILYSVMVLFLMLLLSILGILGSRKATLDKNKKEILNDLNSAITNNRIYFEHRNITIVSTSSKDDIAFALMDGVTAIDNEGNQIDTGRINYDLNLNNIVNGDYTVTYTVNNNGKRIIGTRKITFTDEDAIETFDTSGFHEFSSDKTGNYKLEIWGASGGNVTDFLGGKGGYAAGYVNLSDETDLYFEIGSAGVGATTSGASLNGGYNGGGSVTGNSDVNHITASGGGATHVATTNKGELKNYEDFQDEILMVAGGGGGARNQANHISAARWGAGGAGGGINGIGASSSNGSLTTYTVMSTLAGKENSGYKFGEGESVTANSAGGGGWYGGFGGSPIDDLYAGSGSGGSGYINNDAVVNGIMYAGNEEMPNHDGNGNIIGNTGNGFAKISLIYYY